MQFTETNIETLRLNPFIKFGKEWALLTAGTKAAGFNTMTAAWGGFGVLWSKNVLTVYIRHSRYTQRFFDTHDTFTVSFYEEAYRAALNICGKLHGNVSDKVKKAGLTPYFLSDTTAFEEASLIFCCRKIYHTDIVRETADDTALFDRVYPDNDLHRVYIGEITRVLEKKS